MVKNCYIVSLKYAAGLWKEFHLLGRNLKAQGYAVKFLLSSGYKWMAGDMLEDSYFVTSSTNVKTMIVDAACYPFSLKKQCSDLFREHPPKLLCLYNPHPLNSKVEQIAKKYAPDGIRAIYLHEPAKPGKASYGLKGWLFFEVVELCQRKAIKQSTDIILPSPVAQELFKKYYPEYQGDTHYAPILVPDRPGASAPSRKYFSMVGRFNFSKRLDLFIEAANLSACQSKGYEFQITTSSQLDEYLQLLTPDANKKMKIINKENLSDEEMFDSLAKSYAVLCIHPMVTQSGVVTVAFMNSTPVIVRDSAGFTQFVKHGYNGWVLPKDFNANDIIEALHNVLDNFLELSQNARRTYEEMFSEKTWSDRYEWLIRKLNN